MCTKIIKNLFKIFKIKIILYYIRKMRSQYKNKDLLKIQPFYSREIKSNKKKKRKTKIFPKKPKELTIKQL